MRLSLLSGAHGLVEPEPHQRSLNVQITRQPPLRSLFLEMTSLKRKASDQLTRDDTMARNEPELVQQPPARFSYVWFRQRAIDALTYLVPPAPNPPSPTRLEDNSIRDTAHLKRRKAEGQRVLSEQSTALVDAYKQDGKEWSDVHNCSDEREARELIDSLWSPRDILSKKPKSHRLLTPLSLQEDSGNDSARSQENIDTPKITTTKQVLPVTITQQIVPLQTLPAPKTSLPPIQGADLTSSSEPKSDIEETNKKLDNLLLEDKKSGLPLSKLKEDENIKSKAAKAQKKKADAIRKAQQARLLRRVPPGNLIQDLPEKWAQIVSMASGKRVNETVTTSMGGTELRVKDFNTLLGHRAWLNDEIINTYIEWVVEAANEAAIKQTERLGEKLTTVPKFIAHNSFFYENLRNKGANSTERLMKRKKAPGTSLLEVDSVFVPICSHNHWTIGVVRPIAKTIEYFDSMGGNPANFIRYMRTWLAFQLGKTYVASEWSEPNTRCAHQSNGWDCGVFVCTNAFCVAAGFDTSSYLEEDMTMQRQNIAAVLINRGFNKDFAWREGWELPIL